MITQRKARRLKKSILILPQDILLNIFTVLRDVTTSDNPEASKNNDIERDLDWFTVTHVCRAWRSTGLSNPSLWTHIFYFNSTEKTKVFLERSKSAELIVFGRIQKLEMHHPDEKNVAGERRAKEVLDSLVMTLHHIERIRHLRLFIYYSVRDNANSVTGVGRHIEGYLSGNATHLQELHIGYAPDHGLFIWDCPRFLISFPRLKFLILRKLEMKMKSLLPTKMDLVDLRFHYVKGLTPFDFFTILQSCKNLETLYVHDMVWNIGSGFLERSLEEVTVPLSKLCFLDITLDGARTDKIYQRLELPDDTSWRCYYHSILIESFFSLKSYVYLSQKRFRCEKLSITMESVRLRIQTRNSVVEKDDQNTKLTKKCTSDLELKWGVNNRAQTGAFAYLVSLVKESNWREARSARFNLHSYWWPINEGDWTDLLLCLSSIEHLEVIFGDCRSTNTKFFMNALAHRVRTPSTNGLTVCPKLSYLSLEWEKSVTEELVLDLEKTLQSRKQMDLGLKTLAIRTQPSLKEEVSVLSKLVHEFSWEETRKFRFDFDGCQEFLDSMC